MAAAQSMSRVFGWPAAIGVASLAGLLSALIGDGAWDGLSWTLLALPAGISLLALFRGNGRRQRTTA
jgi:hypothetical protein